MSDMRRFDARQQVTAKPMTRQAYNDLRGWELPVDECGNDDGYLTVDINADSNFDGYDGHVSWKPKALFDDQFYEVDDDAPIMCGEAVLASGTAGVDCSYPRLTMEQELMHGVIHMLSPKYVESRTKQMIEDANSVVSAILGHDYQACQQSERG